MNNLENKFNKIKLKKITHEEKHGLWHNILLARLEDLRSPVSTSISIFHMNFSRILAGVFVLVMLIGIGGGGVVASSKNSLPGDFLFPVDLALEKLQIKFADESKKSELKFKFAEDRISKIKNVSNAKSSTVKFSQGEIDDINAALSDVGVLVQEQAQGPKAENVEKSLNELLVILGDDKDLKVSKTDGEISVTKDETETLTPIKIEDKTDKTNEGTDGGMEVDETVPEVPVEDTTKTPTVLPDETAPTDTAPTPPVTSPN